VRGILIIIAVVVVYVATLQLVPAVLEQLHPLVR